MKNKKMENPSRHFIFIFIFLVGFVTGIQLHREGSVPSTRISPLVSFEPLSLSCLLLDISLESKSNKEKNRERDVRSIDAYSYSNLRQMQT
jgi:hypothetical protein